MFEFLGYLTLLGFCVAVSCMMVESWNTVVRDARKEDKRIFDDCVESEVERRFDNTMDRTQFIVHFKNPRLINESDIDWGEQEERYYE